MITTPTNRIPDAQTLGSSAADSIVPLYLRAAQAQQTDAAQERALAPGDAAQAQALLAALKQLPAPASDSLADRKAYIAAIAQQLRDFKSPQGNARAFATLAQQKAVLKHLQNEVGGASPLYQPLTGVMLGTSNLQSQVNQWMQEVLLSDGTPPEFSDW
ncbi:hypothetical protein LQR31_11950 [Chromobacterium vaccinii]|uniref:hypothetical protein n=1 Tax=Chromobacterium vaccinii TaxID=1108595 RepID=UPI001E2FE248|nr:hypothetical protein [Chromobacterium vaccinii]MCD4485190.1 hypothetical protein [Chromobacterium vaccinii]